MNEIPNIETGYFETETILDGRVCHLVISTLPTLIVTNSSSGLGETTKLLPQNKDIFIYATQLTIQGKIHSPSNRISIFAHQLSVVPGSKPELSTEPPPKINPVGMTAISDVPNTSQSETTPNQKMNLPKSAADFSNGGGRMEWAAWVADDPSQQPNMSDPDYYASLAIPWVYPEPSQGYPAATVSPSGAGGKSATSTGENGVEAFVQDFSIRLIAQQVELTEDLTINAQGGAGANGQNGQKGANGQRGRPITHHWSSNGDDGYAYWDNPPFPFYGGFGGDGGNSCPGGNGGKGGVIKLAVNVATGAGKFKTKADGGAPGQDGIPGAGGIGGAGDVWDWQGYVKIYIPKSNDGQPGILAGNAAVAGENGTIEQRKLTLNEDLQARFFLRLLSYSRSLAVSTIQDLLDLA